MDNAFLLIMLFGIGIFLQAFLFQRQSKSMKSLKYLLIAIPGSLGLAALFYLKMSHGLFDGFMFTFYYLIIFSVSIGFIFKEKILPEINEAHILSITILFWFIFLLYFYSDVWYKMLFAATAVIPTVGTLFICFTASILKNWTKLFFYIWFVIMTIFIMTSYFPFGNISFFWSREYSTSPGLITVFFSGMVFVYLVSYIAYMLYLIPLPGKHQPIKERIEESKEFAKGMIQHYSDSQILPKYSFFLILIQCGILWLNYYLNLISNYLLISIIILFVPAFFKIDKIRGKLLIEINKEKQKT